MKLRLDKKGVALFIVLTSMATLAIFLGEITYVAQINQKLAYDRLDQIKAQSLAKSGLRLALLRIRAYNELKKTRSKFSKDFGADAVNQQLPAEVVEKIWKEPITIPFSGDISGLPTTIQDALIKFRKDSGMEGRLYISIRSLSDRVNLNSYIPSFFTSPEATPTPTPTPNSVASGATPTPTPVVFDREKARTLLTEQIKNSFAARFEKDEKFRDQYRNLRIEDIAEDIMSWNDIAYNSNREQMGLIPYKKSPFYDVSELHYLPSIDDEIYNLLSPEYTAGVLSQINVNVIKDATLKALVPQMTDEERKKFFDDRDLTKDDTEKKQSTAGGGLFQESKDFFNYLKNNVALLKSDASIDELKNNFIARNIVIVVEESQFLVHIEATIQQTKRTLEALVMLAPKKKPVMRGLPNANNPNDPLVPSDTSKTSGLKIIQMRFL